ncbi:phosphotransferase family protein [Kibdelosporangium persicum]|uniref:Kinase, aminoglycoside phosphotransferase (APT) family n=1 Tax=Kibdelosporangium persicum TaxID=2698649 RepID=A0ABX2EW42_9PSEU|nr:phosphotransferase [Kibdelosporangium persicum]NRN63189.1 putative kinase, aminoglycoside phosphotransferase (APT) family [Kibdelosporangium persicum]
MDERVRAWLPGRRIDHAERLSGGHRNENVLIVTDDGERYVLRTYLADNRCAFEAALAVRLEGVVPVPEVVAADPAGDPPLMLSRFVPGTPPTSAAGVGEALARVGSVTFDRPGFLSAALEPDGTEPVTGLAAFVESCVRKGNVLTVAEQRALVRLAERWEPLAASVRGARSLVHSDFNLKNLLVTPDGQVTVLDWEFALSTSPLVDVGNMLRFGDELPPGFEAEFIAGFRAAGGVLPDDWRAVSRALDLFAVADFLTRPARHVFLAKAVRLIREELLASRW